MRSLPMRSLSTFACTALLAAVVGCDDASTRTESTRTESTPPPPTNTDVNRTVDRAADRVDRAVDRTADRVDRTVNDPTRPAGDSTATKPDNTGMNTRDRNDTAVTPFDQSNDAEDIRITSELRSYITAEKSFSFNARNIKIMTAKGVVVLRGPVESATEKANIEAKAKDIKGVTSVRNELEVKPKE